MDGETNIPRPRGRPAKHLLSGIALCGVCSSAVRVGRQNADPSATAPRYSVYECSGTPGQPGFHVSMSCEHLDQIVTEAVIARVLRPDFRSPRMLHEDEAGTERQALRLEIKSHGIWLESVATEAKTRGMGYVLSAQEQIHLPRIAAAKARLAELEQRSPVIEALRETSSARQAWTRLPLLQQRRVVRELMAPRINPVPVEDRGMRGPNPRRVDLGWRVHD